MQDTFDISHIRKYRATLHTSTMAGALNKAISERRFKQARCFINSGVNVNSKCQNGKTALIQLCFLEEDSAVISIAARLLKRGAKIDLTDNDGLSALSMAVLRQKENLVGLFLDEAGNLDLNSQDERGNTALFYAADIGNFNILNSLVIALKKYQLSVDVANHEGITPLIQACLKGNAVCANYLINEGKASTNIRDSKFRKTAAEWAKINGIPESALLSRSVSLSNGFIGDEIDEKDEEKQLEENENEHATKTFENEALSCRKTHGSYKVQLRQIYQVYESQLTTSFKLGKKPKPKMKLPINEEGNPPRSSAKSRNLSRTKTTNRLLKRTSLEKPVSRKSPPQKFQRSQSVTDLTKLIVKDSDRLVTAYSPNSQRSRSARSGRVRQESERPTSSRTPSARSMPTVETVVETNE